jgi:CheY-like chemotaxis protein
MNNLLYIIDDDEDVRDVLLFALEQEGYSLKLFSDPLFALKELKKLSAGQYPFLILVDYFMPQMDGLQFITELKEFYPETAGKIPVVICSAQSDLKQTGKIPKDISRLHKPMDLEVLLNLVKSYYVKSPAS